MKTIFIIFVFITTNVVVSSAQVSCKLLPTSTQHLQMLAHKPVGAHPYEFELGCNVTDSLKKRLLYLLNWQWTKDELNYSLKKNLSDNADFYKIAGQAHKIARGNDSLYKIAVDSITNFYNQEKLENLRRGLDFMVAGGIVLTVAKLNFKEAIPLLEEAVKDSIHYDKWIVELALARFGHKQLQKKLINSYSYDSQKGLNYIDVYRKSVGPKLIFISSQESIYKLHEWLDTSLVMSTIAGRKANLRMAYVVLADLKWIILNKDFQLVAKNFESDFMDAGLDTGPILFCKKWLIRNKGKYDINKNYTPYY